MYDIGMMMMMMIYEIGVKKCMLVCKVREETVMIDSIEGIKQQNQRGVMYGRN